MCVYELVRDDFIVGCLFRCFYCEIICKNCQTKFFYMKTLILNTSATITTTTTTTVSLFQCQLSNNNNDN